MTATGLFATSGSRPGPNSRRPSQPTLQNANEWTYFSRALQGEAVERLAKIGTLPAWTEIIKTLGTPMFSSPAPLLHEDVFAMVEDRAAGAETPKLLWTVREALKNARTELTRYLAVAKDKGAVEAGIGHIRKLETKLFPAE